MKILIVSDSHGSMRVIRQALEENPEIKTVLHAGDGALDMNEFSGCGLTVYRVRGNCDGDIPIEDVEIADIDGVKLLLTHGHLFKVSYQTDMLVSRAKEEGCAAAVFGHTHRAVAENKDGVLLINPGTANRSRSKDGRVSYALLEIENGDITGIKIKAV